MTTTRKRKHGEVAQLAALVCSLRKSNPRPTLREIAQEIGVSYWAARHYIAGECKALTRLGR